MGSESRTTKHSLLDTRRCRFLTVLSDASFSGFYNIRGSPQTSYGQPSPTSHGQQLTRDRGKLPLNVTKILQQQTPLFDLLPNS